MRKPLTVLGMATLGAIALHETPAAAQGPVSQEIQIYAGELFGDRLTETPISRNRPRLDDSFTFGGRYNYNFTDMWGVQLSAGSSPSRAAHVASGNSDLYVTTLDLDAVWNIGTWSFTPGYKITPYTVVGVGYAWANLDRAMQGVVGATPVTITDSNGYTANVGFGAKYYLTDNLFIDLDARYRYFSRLVSNYGQGLNTAETTLGVGWRF